MNSYDDIKQAEARTALGKWLKCEQESLREAYKSELAQQSLELIVTAV